ncbi:MAG: YitT family protein, partial [Alistipes sp.]|nr:YitT family protein [Alistipes sp.]
MNKKIDIKKFTEPIFSLEWWWSWFMILFGCTLLAAGYVFFISPYNIVPGGIYGASIVLHNIFPSIQVGTFGYMFDIPLMILAFLIFGGQFGSRTIVAALYTPGIMNILTRLAYPNEEALQSLDPSQMLGGILDLSNHLMLASFIGSVFLGVGVGIVVRQRATTGGTDIVAMMIQKYFRIGFSKAVLLADSVVVLSGLLVIGFGFGTGEPNPDGWMLSFYSLVTIYVTSRVLEYVISGASSNRLLFIIFDKHNEELRRFILHDLDRSATYVKAQGMYSGDDKEMIFLVVPT